MRRLNIKPQIKTILFCTIFNLFFESSLRGINEFLSRPLLFCVLIVIYLTLFIMLEDLITRFKFEDKHIILFACCYGTLYFLVSSSIYMINPWFFGVNIGILLFVSIVWWAFYQILFPLYLSHRLFSRNWDHKQLSMGKWIIIIALHSLANFLIIISPATGIGTPLGYITTILIAIIYGLFLLRSLKKRNSEEFKIYTSNQQEHQNFQNVKIFDILGIISFGLMGFCAIFLTSDQIQVGSSLVNAMALMIMNVWTFFVMLIEIIIWIRRRKIPI